MTTIRDRALPLLEKFRGRLDTRYGLRRYNVLIRVNTWTAGTLPGAQGSAKTHVDTPLEVGGGGRPKVEQLTQRDIFASGGLYQDQDMRIGPLTPAFTGGGVDVSVFDPAVVGPNVEVLFQLMGPGFESGAWFKKISQKIDGNFRYTFVVRKTGEQNA